MAGNDTENLPVKEVESESVSYLTLGDGDFTYSLDLARYMKLSGSSQTLSPTKPHKNTRLILTGVDTLEALTSKYKDSAFILQDIRNQQDEMPSMSLRIQHGVNAIIHPDEKERAKGPLHECADHVMFHHPHLGTENCSLHKRFLAHLFFSVDRHWMKPKGGVFHLTLVEGQFERWKCLEQAKRHGLDLLYKSPFAPPPVATSSKGGSTGNRYHYRRHQTGKSFATRRPNSRSFTYTFGRTVDHGFHVATTLPWQIPCPSSSDTGTEKIEKPVTVVVPTSSMLPCTFCEKEFAEKRSLKCHLCDKHSCDKATIEQMMNNGNQTRTKKRKQEMISTTTIEQAEKSFACLQCLPNRIFQSEKALQSHIRAKHSGMHTYIKPDWSTDNTNVCQRANSGEPSVEPHLETDTTKSKECEICGFQLVDGSFSLHFQDFVPVDESQTFSCDFCSKLFREERAKLQHMNFCSKRPNSTNFES